MLAAGDQVPGRAGHLIQARLETGSGAPGDPISGAARPGSGRAWWADFGCTRDPEFCGRDLTYNRITLLKWLPPGVYGCTMKYVDNHHP